MRKPLEGVRIIDFCWVGAGSYTTKLLADQGADVIKIESEAKVDGIRLSPPFAGGVQGVNRSGYFADRNTSKRSMAINMKEPQGRDIARRLISVADVVTNNFTPGVMSRFGLSYEEVKAFNPGIVYLSMSMQGDSGPERDFLGYGLTISALVGLHYLTGIPGRPPIGTGTNYPDHIPNPCHAAFAVLAALRHRRRTGEGQYIDMAQTEATIAVLGSAVMEYTVNGRDRDPIGNRHERYVPHGVYRCAGDDRWLAIAITTDAEFAALCAELPLDDERVDPLMDAAGRRELEDELDALIEERTRESDARSLADRLQAAGIPAGPVHDPSNVVDDDPQLSVRHHWVRLKHPEMGETIYNASPFRFSRTPTEVRSAAPLLGEHTSEICRELLGMSEEEVSNLAQSGVLR